VIAQALVEIAVIGRLWMLPAIMCALIGVIVGWIVTFARRPMAINAPETRKTEARAR
jgi:hypothetical protein